MEIAPCPICGSTEFEIFLEVPDRFDTTGKKRWTLVRSRGSGLVMLNPRPGPSEMHFHYRSVRYDPHLTEEETASTGERFYLALRRMLLGYRAHIVLKGSKRQDGGPSVLEVGCSTGDFLGFLHRKKGIALDNLEGIEIDRAAAEHARKKFGLEVCSDLWEDSRQERQFDRIVLWHTLEHIHNVGETLDLLSGLIRKEGTIVLALPNHASPDAAIYRENWIAWDAPRHLCHYTPETLAALLEQHNLKIAGSMPYFPDTVFNIFHSEKLASRMEGKPVNAIRMLHAAVKSALALPGYFVRPSCASGIVYFVRRA